MHNQDQSSRSRLRPTLRRRRGQRQRSPRLAPIDGLLRIAAMLLLLFPLSPFACIYSHAFSYWNPTAYSSTALRERQSRRWCHRRIFNRSDHASLPRRTTVLSLSSSSSVADGGSNANELFPLRRGLSVALVTPFDPTTGGVDLESLDSLLDYHLEAGTDNLCILGTTGEASLLSFEERKLVLERAVGKAKGRMCLLVGVGTIDPTDIKAMTQQAIDVGCDAALVVTPYYVKPPQRGLIQHMIACAGYGLPTCVYNVPSRTGVNMLDESLAEAALRSEGIVAVKDATGDLYRARRLRELTRDERPDLLLLSGDDATSLEFVLEGTGDGCISVTANVAAREMKEMMRLALEGQREKAREIDLKLEGLHRDLFLESNPIPAKWATFKLGLISSDYCRPPLCSFDAETLGVQLEESLHRAGLLL